MTMHSVACSLESVLMSFVKASSSKEESLKRAQIALSILQDTQQLLSKGVSEGNDSPLKRVVGKYSSVIAACAVRNSPHIR